MLSYRIPAGVQPQTFAARPLLTTQQGGSIALDAPLMAIWQQAGGRTLSDLLAADWSAPPVSLSATNSQRGFIIRAALACLCEAGLLERVTDPIPEAIAALPQEFSTPPDDSSLISIIIVNYNSSHWLDECLTSLHSQTPSGLRFEIILVDNASTEDPLPWLAEHYPTVRTLRLQPGYGLAHAINRGVELAQGEYFLLLNPDTRLAPNAISALLAAYAKQSSPAPALHPDPSPSEPHDETPLHSIAVPKLRYTWAPAFLNGLGNRVGPAFWGADNAQGHLDLGQFDDWQQLPSACFAATIIPRQVWQKTGPLDEEFFIYYEDAEWSYRARLLGAAALAVPQAVIYHAFGQRTHTGQDVDLTPFKLRNVVHGRLRLAYKLLSPLTAARFLINYALEDLARFMLYSLRGRRPLAHAVLDGWRTFFHKLPSLRAQRQALQSRRIISDRQLFAYQQSAQCQIPPPFIWRGLPELSWDIIQHVYLPLMLARKTRPMPELETTRSQRPSLLIISQDIVGEKMAGPGMRYLEMARTLSADLDVTLAFPGEGSTANRTLPEKGLRLFPYRFEHPGAVETLVNNSDVVLFSSFILDKFSFLQKSHARRVVDLYDPLVLENLYHYKDQPLDVQEGLNQQAVASMNRLLQTGDYFICGNLRQRDLWLGALMTNGRVTPGSFAQDNSLLSLIDVVGVGFPSRDPLVRPFLRDQHPAFNQQSRIVLWGGGIWDWLDPLSLIRAWPQVVKQHPQARLVLLGTRHPNPLVPPHKMAERAIALAEELGEKERTIFFYEWLTYEDREALLCEADVGVTLHPLHAETRYSIRTRILDYFWAGLPTLVSSGDVTSEWVRQYQLGRVVPPMDVDAVAKGLNELLSQPKAAWAPAFAHLAEVFAWPEVVAPLRRYCLSERSASPNRPPAGHLPLATTRLPLSTLFARARAIWRTEGAGVLLHRLWRYVQWRLSRL